MGEGTKDGKMKDKVMLVNMETGKQTEFDGCLIPAPEPPEELTRAMDLSILHGFQGTIKATKPLSALRMRWAFGLFPPGVPRRRIRRPEWRDL